MISHSYRLQSIQTAIFSWTTYPVSYWNQTFDETLSESVNDVWSPVEEAVMSIRCVSSSELLLLLQLLLLLLDYLYQQHKCPLKISKKYI